MSIYNVGNLRKVTTPTSNTIANAKLKFGGNQTNDDANSANKPVKVSSSISEKIKKLSSSTSSGEISDTVTNNTLTNKVSSYYSENQQRKRNVYICS